MSTWQAVDGLNRLVSCIHRSNNAMSVRCAASGSMPCAAHQVTKGPDPGGVLTGDAI
jgi:hypothetical protein